MAGKIVGIPDRKNYGSLQDIKQGDLLEFVRQLHEAEKAGKHFDFRIGNKDLGLFSWATKKGYPKPGDKPTQLFRQPIHSYGYRKFRGRIRAGYGKGKVTRLDHGKILVTRKKGDQLSFTTVHDTAPKRFSLIPTNGDALMVQSKGPKHAPAAKPKFKSIPTTRVAGFVHNIGPKDVVQPKVDGALTFYHLLPNKDIEALSHRTSKRTGGPIWHTERFWGYRPKMLGLPKEYKNTVLLAEMYGERKGKVVPPQLLGGILNSTVATALQRQKAEGIKLKAMVFDMTGPKAEGLTYPEKLEEIKKIIKLLPDKDRFHVPESVEGPTAGEKLLDRIRAGKNPLTQEGVIVRKADGTGTKAKLMSETDVFIRDVFEGAGKYKDRGAGGFSYSLTADGPIVGKCGTGMLDQLRQDMWKSPQDYLGRVARIKYQSQYKKTGAYRVPVLLAIHESR